MGWVSDYFRRRQLRPVIGQLPHLLERRYGAAAFFPVAQVRSTVIAMKLHPRVLTAAYAVACDVKEFLSAHALFTEQIYRAERQEIARLTGLDERDLNCRYLTKVAFSNAVGEGSNTGTDGF
jgi:hypothetical protein